MRYAGTLLAVSLLAGGCATTPEEFDRVRAENELLRAEIQVIKRNCSYYREVEVEAEEADSP